MPYASNQALPDSVKSNLPESAQNIWRNAFNSAFDKHKDDSQASQIAWEALKNAGWVKDSEGNWKKSSSELKDVEIFSAGTWAGEMFTESDLDDIVNNFNNLKDKIKPPLKIAHKNNMHKKDGQPALGWVTDLKRIGKKLIASFTDVPNIVKDALSKRLYKRVSSEIYNNLSIGGKKYKRALAGVGILGADIPEVKDLQDIEIFFSDSGSITHYELDVTNGVINYSEESIMDENKLEKQYNERVKLIEDKFEIFKSEFTKKFSERENKLKEENDNLKNQLTQQKRNEKILEFKAFCEKAVADGKMAPAARDVLVTASAKMEFSEDNNFSIPLETFQAYMDKTHEILDKMEHGFHLSNTERDNKPAKNRYSEIPGMKFENVDLDTQAQKYAAEHKVTYTEALRVIMENDSKLFSEFGEVGKEG